MGLMDSMKDKAQDAMNDDGQRQKIEQLAKEKGISIEAAKEHLRKQDNKS